RRLRSGRPRAASLGFPFSVLPNLPRSCATRDLPISKTSVLPSRLAASDRTATAERAAARGEPWLSFFSPAKLAALLRDKGFTDIEDLGFAESIGRFRSDGDCGAGGRARRALAFLFQSCQTCRAPARQGIYRYRRPRFCRVDWPL